MTDFQSGFASPILASALPDPARFLAILCQMAEANPALQDALIATVREMARRHLAEAAGLKATRDLRRLARKGGAA